MRTQLLLTLALGLSGGAVAQSPTVGATDAPDTLNLACEGDWYKGGSGTGGFARMYVKIDGAGGVVQMPEPLSAPSRQKRDGWDPLQDVVVGETAITAKVRVNMLAHARIEIDRVHGEIDISGPVGVYAGSCKPYDPDVVRRAF